MMLMNENKGLFDSFTTMVDEVVMPTLIIAMSNSVFNFYLKCNFQFNSFNYNFN